MWRDDSITWWQFRIITENDGERCRDRYMAMAVFVAITQGILVAGLSNYVNQIVKQARKKE